MIDVEKLKKIVSSGAAECEGKDSYCDTHNKRSLFGWVILCEDGFNQICAQQINFNNLYKDYKQACDLYLKIYNQPNADKALRWVADRYDIDEETARRKIEVFKWASLN